MKTAIPFLLFFCSFLYGNSENEPGSMRKATNKFIENRGQLVDDSGAAVPFVLFKSSSPGMDYFITTSGITYIFSKCANKGNESEREDQQERSKTNDKKDERALFYTERIELVLQDAKISSAQIIKERPSAHHYNYFFSHCPGGIYDVKEYEKITVKDVYPGIDWVLYGNNSTGFKYDFMMHPGSDVTSIKLLYKSGREPRLETNGDVKINGKLGVFTERKPLSYTAADKTEIPSSFRLISTSKKKHYYETLFQLDGDFQKFDKENVIIDPQLVWATLYGGSMLDGPMSIETDANDNVFTCGYTYSMNYPVNNTGNGSYFQSTYVGIANFITKFLSSGAMDWSTFYGNGNPEKSPKGLAVDKFGDVWVAGETNSNTFPLQNNGGYYQATNASQGDIFILKFTNTGVRLWATYFGGSGMDRVNAIDTDTLGNMYLVGGTFSTNFPLVNAGGYYQNSYTATNAGIAIVAKFSQSCNLIWSTFFGNYYSLANAVNCDRNNNVFITGGNFGVGVPTVNPGGGSYFQATPGNTITGFSQFAFISKFDVTTNLLWSTNYGGSTGEFGACIVSDPSGNIFVGGRSASSDLPLMFSPGTFSQSSMGSGWRPFILKFNNAGVRLWATFCGGDVTAIFDTFDNLAIDACNSDVNYTFSTPNRSLTIMPACDGGYLQSTMTPTAGTMAPTDIAILKFTNNGSLLWSTYLGGSGDDFRSAVATDKNGNLYMTGEWTGSVTSTYPLTNPGGSAFFDNTANGTDDAYLVKFSPVVTTATFSYPGPICNASGTIAPALSAGVTGTFAGSPGLNINQVNGVVNCGLSPTGTYTVSFYPNSCGCFTTGALIQTLTIGSAPQIVISSSSPSVCAGQSVGLIANSTSSTALNYTWTPFGSNSYSITFSPTVSTICNVAALDANTGCTSTASVFISVQANPTVSISGPSGICQSATVTLLANGTGVFLWNNGQNGNTCTISPLINSLYTVTCTSSGGCTNQATHAVSIYGSPTIGITGSTVICKGSSVTLTATGALNYLWNNGSSGSSMTATFATNAVITVTGTSLNGCQKTQSSSIVVTDCTGLNEVSQGENLILIYPNPSTGEITIKAASAMNLYLEDERGRLIQQVRIDENSLGVNIKLAEGIYFLRGDIKGRTVKEKIIIQNR